MNPSMAELKQELESFLAAAQNIQAEVEALPESPKQANLKTYVSGLVKRLQQNFDRITL